MYTITAKVIGFHKILISTNNLKNFNMNKLIIKNGANTLHINNYTTTTENSILVFIKEEINIKYYSFVIYDCIKIKALYKDLFLTSEFNDKFYYDGKLGLIYTKKTSTFKLWSPAASSVDLLLYKNGDPTITEPPLKFKMTEKNGLWTITINKNLKNYFYTYKVTTYNYNQEAIDPYATAVGINGLRAAIIDLKETNPHNFKNDYTPKTKHNTDAIIYELNIRDISMHESSGVIQKGKFLALTEDNTSSKKNVLTCLSHIKDLGVTHVQLMPCFDFSSISIDEKNAKDYNWGYDPENYNVPEGSFSLNPYDPKCRILEIKKMIQHLHSENICVNMDVVYNHIFHKTQNNFEKIFPGYYFRLDNFGDFSNGSGCGNDTASEHKMMRKFILDSVLYWAEEYHIDGFRFDLMGIHDVNTMNSIYDTFKNLNKNIMLYGEGWNLNTALDDSLRATQKNAKEMPNISFFNDIIRDTIKGNVFSKLDKGFVSGKQNLENKIKSCITGCTISNATCNSIYVSPEQSINYVSCHDNHTLWDKFELSNNTDTLEDKKNMVKLSNAIVLTSQGIPFLHSGVEFCRTKYCIENSFKSPDIINSLDYDRKFEFLDVYEYCKGLIKIRKKHPAFRMYSTEDIKLHLNFIQNTPKNTVAFLLKDNANGDSWENILVIYNANRYSVTLEVPNITWYKVVNKYHANTKPIETVTSDKIEVESLCMNMFYST
ncbi:type I pullulanase [Clostridium ganghwense]|uniref:Type I pullulanase n=1 Tax=Clostridium ganghwense TaxID=312089 RepID=A0ABT4CL07_9CLOT|nr:type I pullulanase [Clostridium ganghwense]MCY6369730.1 type I pullulanase [Clostridium ganghwense]